MPAVMAVADVYTATYAGSDVSSDPGGHGEGLDTAGGNKAESHSC